MDLGGLCCILLKGGRYGSLDEEIGQWGAPPPSPNSHQQAVTVHMVLLLQGRVHFVVIRNQWVIWALMVVGNGTHRQLQSVKAQPSLLIPRSPRPATPHPPLPLLSFSASRSEKNTTRTAGNWVAWSPSTLFCQTLAMHRPGRHGGSPCRQHSLPPTRHRGPLGLLQHWG